MTDRILITAVCFGILAVLVLAFSAWDAANVRRTSRLLADPEAPQVVDCEDHDDHPSPEEERMLRGVEDLLREEARRFSLARVEDLDLGPVKKAEIRRRVLAGQDYDAAVGDVLGGGR